MNPFICQRICTFLEPKAIKMLLRITLFFLFSALQLQLSAQKFPEMTAEDSDGESVELPSSLKGKKSIVFLAMTAQAEEQLDDWYYPVYMMFLDKSGFNAMAYDCHVRLMMMFTGASKAAADQVIEKMKKNVSEDMKDNVLFYEGNMSSELKDLGVKKKNDCHVLVLDENGKVIYSDTGAYSEKKLDKIASLVEL